MNFLFDIPFYRKRSLVGECRSAFLRTLAAVTLICGELALQVSTAAAKSGAAYFPPPESQGGWRRLETPEEIRRPGGADPEKLAALKDWLLASDDRDFAAVVIHNGYIVLEVERGNSAKSDSRRVA